VKRYSPEEIRHLQDQAARIDPTVRPALLRLIAELDARQVEDDYRRARQGPELEAER
jgi:hypothetical protein